MERHRPLIIAPRLGLRHPETERFLGELKLAGYTVGDAMEDRWIDVRSRAASFALGVRPKHQWFLFIEQDVWTDVGSVQWLQGAAESMGKPCVYAAVTPEFGTHVQEGFDASPPYALGREGGPLQARSAKLGLALIHRKVLDRMTRALPRCPWGWPFFMPSWDELGHHDQTEAFCRRVYEFGFVVWVDTRLVINRGCASGVNIGEIVQDYHRKRTEQPSSLQMLSPWV